MNLIATFHFFFQWNFIAMTVCWVVLIVFKAGEHDSSLSHKCLYFKYNSMPPNQVQILEHGWLPLLLAASQIHCDAFATNFVETGLSLLTRKEFCALWPPTVHVCMSQLRTEKNICPAKNFPHFSIRVYTSWKLCSRHSACVLLREKGAFIYPSSWWWSSMG